MSAEAVVDGTAEEIGAARGQDLATREQLILAAFKRGVEFRQTTNAPVPSDAEILRKFTASERAGMSAGEQFAALAHRAELALSEAECEPLGSEDQASAMDELLDLVRRMGNLTDDAYADGRTA